MTHSPSDPPAADPTRLLERIAGGDAGAACELLPLVYGELHRVAEALMERQPAGHTLQPTALVHEAWLKLFGGKLPGELRDRGHFLSVAARAMRQVLIDHVRARRAERRGGGAQKLGLDQLAAAIEEEAVDVLGLHEALEELERLDPELAQVVELRFFAGLTIEATAKALGVSTPTIERRWRVARMLLRERLPALR